MATLLEVSKIMAVMSRFYPHYEMGEGIVELYAAMLPDIPPDALEAAAKKIITTSTFFPSLAEWRLAALDILHDQASVPAPFEAWANVLSEMRRVGSYGKPQFSHPLIARAVEGFGWRELCLSENQDYDRAHFTKAYQQLQERRAEETRALPEVKAVVEKYRIESGGVKKLERAWKES